MVKDRRSLTVVLGVAFLWSTSAALGVSPEDKCESVKNKIAGKYAFCRQKAIAKKIRTGDPADFSKCNDRLDKKWGKAEQKAIDKGTACVDDISAPVIKSFLQAHVDTVASALDGGTLGCPLPATGEITSHGAGSDGYVQAGAALSYTDNLDGTITDNNTGLMWEKKDDSGGIHDKDDTYSWCDASCGGANEMDGTITTTFLAALNGGGGFAGHTDWRIPNFKELQSIVDYGVFFPSVDPAFHQSATCTGCVDVTLATCSCTALFTYSYWSSTSVAPNPSSAWLVDFYAGDVDLDDKMFNERVRAVRGGS